MLMLDLHLELWHSCCLLLQFHQQISSSQFIVKTMFVICGANLAAFIFYARQRGPILLG